MGGALHVEHGVRDAPARLRERLLELGLVVDVGRARVLDPVGEGGDDRRFDRLVAVLEEERRDRGLEQRGGDVAALDDPAQLVAGERLARRFAEPLAEAQLPRDGGAALARDDVRADLRQPPLGRVRDSGRRAPSRSRARARCRPGTPSARTTTRGRAPRTCA